jgi:hypothetical protein
METRVYTGDISSGRVYDPIYTGKVKLSHVYEALYMTVIKLSRIQVREKYFERVLTKKNGLSLPGWLLNGGKGSMRR